MPRCRQIDGYEQPPFQAQVSGDSRSSPRAHARRPCRAIRSRARSSCCLELVGVGERSLSKKSEPSSRQLGAHAAARAPVLAAERHVHPAGGSRPSSSPHGEHVERRLQAVLGLPARDLVASTRLPLL